MFGNVRELPRQLRKACALPYLEGVVSEGRGWDVRFQKIPWGIAVPPILDSTFKVTALILLLCVIILFTSLQREMRIRPELSSIHTEK